MSKAYVTVNNKTFYNNNEGRQSLKEELLNKFSVQNIDKELKSSHAGEKHNVDEPEKYIVKRVVLDDCKEASQFSSEDVMKEAASKALTTDTENIKYKNEIYEKLNPIDTMVDWLFSDRSDFDKSSDYWNLSIQKDMNKPIGIGASRNMNIKETSVVSVIIERSDYNKLKETGNSLSIKTCYPNMYAYQTKYTDKKVDLTAYINSKDFTAEEKLLLAAKQNGDPCNYFPDSGKFRIIFNNENEEGIAQEKRLRCYAEWIPEKSEKSHFKFYTFDNENKEKKYISFYDIRENQPEFIKKTSQYEKLYSEFKGNKDKSKDINKDYNKNNDISDKF